MNDWPLNDSQLATVVFLGVIIIVSIVAGLRKTGVRRVEFDRLQEDVKQPSEEVRALLLSEQRRLLLEIKASKIEDDAPSVAASRPFIAREVPLEPALDARHPDLRLLKREAILDGDPLPHDRVG